MVLRAALPALPATIRPKNMSMVTKASTRFIATPARDTIISSLLGCLKLRVLTGTGFAQPKRTSIIIMSPIRSIWARGFSVILPKL